MQRFLLPHRFKTWGAVLFPLGLLGWIAVQSSATASWISFLHFPFPYFQISLIACFLGSLSGLFFLLFSKEKKEDEFIQKIRVESFQLAALIQFIYLIYSFIRIVLTKELRNEQEYLLLMFASTLVIFWLAYIIRFNFLLYKTKRKASREE